MTNVAVLITPPGGSATDYASSVLFERASFTTQFNGVPGTFDIYVRDPDRALSFVTGSEIALVVDGVTLFGGYIRQVGMTSLAPAADTNDLSAYTLRAWHLTGSDYNIIFDARIVRDTANYQSAIATGLSIYGAVLRTLVTDYADMSDFSTAGIDDVYDDPDLASVGGANLEQGKPIRASFETYAKQAAAVYFCSQDKVISFKAYDNLMKRWGFSDNPNHAAITASPADTFQNATYGFRQVEAVEDATYMANDVLVWGGSQWSGPGGGTVFARYQDAVADTTVTADTYIQSGAVTPGSSIATHGRWQHPEVHFGETMYQLLGSVMAQAEAFLFGPPGTDVLGQTKGLKNPQYQFSFTWTSAQTPLLSGTPDFIRAGDLVTIELSAFGVTKVLPLRQMRISFPNAFLDPTDHLVQFDGTFGLQLSDGFGLWRYTMGQRSSTQVLTQQVVNNDSSSTSFGAIYSDTPSPAPDGSTTVFSIPYGYIASTVQVWLNGILQAPGTDYTESDPAAGQITFTTAPLASDTIIVVAQTLAS